MKTLITRTLVLGALVVSAAACSGAAGQPSAVTAQPTPQVVNVTPAPTTKPTAKPTTKPVATPEPTPAIEPLNQAEIDAALATEDCSEIVALGDEERIGVTTDVDVLTSVMDAAGRCLTGEYVDPNAPHYSAGQENAIQTAEDYLDTMAFSRSGLIDQLKYEGFSKKDATFAVDHVHANWKQQAYLSAKEYLDSQSFSLSGLIGQLKYEGFSKDQAKYGATKAYNE